MVIFNRKTNVAIQTQMEYWYSYHPYSFLKPVTFHLILISWMCCSGTHNLVCTHQGKRNIRRMEKNVLFPLSFDYWFPGISASSSNRFSSSFQLRQYYTLHFKKQYWKKWIQKALHQTVNYFNRNSKFIFQCDQPFSNYHTMSGYVAKSNLVWNYYFNNLEHHLCFVCSPRLSTTT